MFAVLSFPPTPVVRASGRAPAANSIICERPGAESNVAYLRAIELSVLRGRSPQAAEEAGMTAALVQLEGGQSAVTEAGTRASREVVDGGVRCGTLKVARGPTVSEGTTRDPRGPPTSGGTPRSPI